MMPWIRLVIVRTNVLATLSGRTPGLDAKLRAELEGYRDPKPAHRDALREAFIYAVRSELSLHGRPPMPPMP